MAYFEWLEKAVLNLVLDTVDYAGNPHPRHLTHCCVPPWPSVSVISVMSLKLIVSSKRSDIGQLTLTSPLRSQVGDEVT